MSFYAIIRKPHSPRNTNRFSIYFGDGAWRRAIKGRGRRRVAVNAVSFWRKSDSNNLEAVEDRVFRARQGDTAARESIIREYASFALKIASSTVRRYVEPEKDDEASIALIALNEAIDSYASQNPGFLAFAATVVKRRVIDWIRKSSKYDPVALEQETFTQDDDWQEALERRDEIESWKRLLREYGLTVEKVATKTPRHSDTSKRLVRIARFLASSEKFRKAIIETKKLPVREVAEALKDAEGCSVKTLERHKEYILAVFTLYTGDFPEIRRYVGAASREEL